MKNVKNLAIGILVIATVIVGGLYLHQTRKAKQAQASADGLQQNVSELQSSLDEQEKRTTRLRDELEETRADATAKTTEATHIRETLQENLTNQAAPAMAGTVEQTNPTNSKPSNPLTEMFKNPEMKEMIKNQQKTVLSAMIDKNYGKFFSDLHLTPEQSSALKDMILDKQLGATEIGLSMFSGDSDGTNRAELAQQAKAATDAGDAKIKEFLGEENFAQFQAYEKSITERMAVGGLKDQLGSGPNALTDYQEEQLIQAMTQERQNFKFATDLSDQSKFTGDFASMFTEDKMNGYFQELGQLDQQYLSRAQSILSQDQLTAFEKHLNSQQALQKAGMQMAAKMFAPPK